MSPESKKLFNIVILGVAFMFMFTAFQTCGNVAVSWNLPSFLLKCLSGCTPAVTINVYVRYHAKIAPSVFQSTLLRFLISRMGSFSFMCC